MHVFMHAYLHTPVYLFLCWPQVNNQGETGETVKVRYIDPSTQMVLSIGEVNIYGLWIQNVDRRNNGKHSSRRANISLSSLLYTTLYSEIPISVQEAQTYVARQMSGIHQNYVSDQLSCSSESIFKLSSVPQPDCNFQIEADYKENM